MIYFDEILSYDKLVRDNISKLTISDVDKILDCDDSTLLGSATIVSIVSGISIDSIKLMSLYEYRVLCMVVKRVLSEIRVKDSKISHFRILHDPTYGSINNTTLSDFLYQYYRVKPDCKASKAISMLPGLIHRLTVRDNFKVDFINNFKSKITNG